MRELTRQVALQKLIASQPADSDPPSPHLTPQERVARLVRHLLVLGLDLRAEVPDLRDFLHTAASAANEAAFLISPFDFSAERAIDYLGAHQRSRLRRRPAPADAWRFRPPELHLTRAFWQLAGLALEVMAGSFTDGQIEEHAADLANYLLFTAVTSGAWELGVRPPRSRGRPNQRPLGDSRRRSPSVFPAWDFPQDRNFKGENR